MKSRIRECWISEFCRGDGGDDTADRADRADALQSGEYYGTRYLVLQYLVHVYRVHVYTRVYAILRVVHVYSMPYVLEYRYFYFFLFLFFY